ncbi:enoyl-CoA hydratase/isomerase family protein [Dietzia sp. KRD202]|uniref:enoyl-CoA hydratase/isomerase family protein n=1 Tax=Dietzia sp. KRD202 TaxID=2729732 RepID=UPI0019D212DA|nr:enoyl-CoA hydratase-related protein [Dietzia sp. KRD202]
MSDERTFGHVRGEVDADGVGAVTLDRPERLNAVDGELIGSMIDAFTWVGEHQRCRSVVLAGRGLSFCAGLDLHNGLGTNTFHDPVLEVEHGIRRGAAVVRIMREIPQPVIAAVHGYAVGAGFAFAAAADIRLASPDARFNAVFVKIGMSAGDLGLSWLLPRIIGAGRAADLFLTGSELTAQHALAAGFVAGIESDPHAAAQRRARDIALLPSYGVVTTKRLLNASLDVSGLHQHLESEVRAQALGMLTDDHRAALQRFRTPRAAAIPTPTGAPS